MKVDTHLHLLPTKASKPNWQEIEMYFEIAKINNLDHLCISEHRDAVYYEELMTEIFLANRFNGRQLDKGLIEFENGLTISPAAEVAIKGGGDVGVHTKLESLLSLNNTKGHYTLFELHRELKKSTNDYFVVAHHLFWNNKWLQELTDAKNAFLIEAIEIPGKDFMNESKYMDIAKRLQKPVVGASDSHTWLQLGACSTELPVDKEGFNFETMFRSIRGFQSKASLSMDVDQILKRSKAYRQVMLS